MPMLWDRSKREKRTPFSDLLSDYLEAHWPMRPKHLAVQTGLSATAIQRYLNNGVVPHDPRILEKIHAGTGIPLADLYQSVGIWVAAALPVEAKAPLSPPPASMRSRRATKPAQIAEQADPYAPLGDYVRRIRASGFPADLEKALIDTAVQAVTGYTPEQLHWQQRLREEHDPEAISTLLLPAVQPAAEAARDTDQAQEESQPAGRRS